MSTETTTTPDVDTTALTEIEERVLTHVTLADLIRNGSKNTKQSIGWGGPFDGAACALSAASIEASRAGII
jgi:hypothetical protein